MTRTQLSLCQAATQLGSLSWVGLMNGFQKAWKPLTLPRTGMMGRGWRRLSTRLTQVGMVIAWITEAVRVWRWTTGRNITLIAAWNITFADVTQNKIVSQYSSLQTASFRRLLRLVRPDVLAVNLNLKLPANCDEMTTMHQISKNLLECCDIFWSQQSYIAVLRE